MINKSHARQIRASIAEGPLQHDEIRRVVGLGGQFIALASTSVGDEYAHTLEFSFEGVDYKIYSKVGLV